MVELAVGKVKGSGVVIVGFKGGGVESREE